MNGEIGQLDLVIGTCWGDEGKGLAARRLATDVDAVVGYNGTNNAGHTNVIGEDIEVNTHQLPVSVFYEGKLAVIASGAYMSPVALFEEIDDVEGKTGIPINTSNLVVDYASHLVQPAHILEDRRQEDAKSAKADGSTKRGVRQVARDKADRIGLRVEDIELDPDFVEEVVMRGLEAENQARREQGVKTFEVYEEFDTWWQAAKQLKDYTRNTAELLTDMLREGKHILGEGKQALGLDLEEGTYPLVTSSYTSPGGALMGMGVSPEFLNDIYGVTKLNISRVPEGSGPFPTRITDEDIAERVRGIRGEIDSGFGKSTGRRREGGWSDLQLLRSAKRIGVNKLVITMLDHAHRLGDTMLVAVSYNYEGETLTTMPRSAKMLAKCVPNYVEMPTWTGDIGHIRRYKDAPAELRNYVEFVEEEVDLPVVAMGVGPRLDQVITR